MTKIKPHWQILAALVLATLTAFLFRGLDGEDGSGASGFISGAVKTFEFLGKDIFMNLLKMIIVPLIVSSVVAGIASLHGMEGFGRMLGKTAGFYAFTGLFAILVGLSMVNLIKPGLTDGEPNETIEKAFKNQFEGASESDKEKVAAAKAEAEGIGPGSGGFFKLMANFVKGMIPTNVMKAASDNRAMLGLIFFSILFAVATTRLPVDSMGTMREFFQSLNDVMILLTRWIMALAPIGVYALLLPVVYKSGGEIFVVLGKYFFTVLASLLIHFVVIMPLILRYVGKVNPLAHFKAMRTALLTAFSTASSSATLPVTMRCVQDNAGVSKKIASFTLPLGATVNMNGTALYECVAVIFVAQVMGIEMGFGQQFIVVLAALLTSIGVAGIPSASLVAIFIILLNSGIPGAEIAIMTLLAVDRLLDMSRTAVNVLGDSCAAVVVARSEGETGILEETATLPAGGNPSGEDKGEAADDER
ncbi:MAG: dicarboxylate/amino acid:cation symporter [Roseibacillus sp.]|jgi:Na+/H+-dicarboxylate symporter|nr:dicarboxylate/amino acid:cation symporter [Roseibacillus sp.]MDP7497356.1 dicarboxylate/amino acid:cation symporter [Roseibacillus sp.]MDP7655701.1 dicarboxylate/amino acid:cation symporter [Roseibacillus sp.]HJM64827.1 dicarboxylate/amino acid:cation symporter [Roseibacillus sp.]|tara:strand:+ start:1365 stop:2789 length:1425 start_codon:yes stop_codon:yes gene_type:complete